MSTGQDQLLSAALKARQRAIAQESQEVIPSAGPITDLPQREVEPERFVGRFIEHPSIEQALREHFGKVQIGEDRIIVSVPTNVTDPETTINLIQDVIHSQAITAEVSQGNREGHYRIAAL